MSDVTSSRTSRRISTSRLALRPLTLNDVDEFHRLCVLPDVRRYLLDNATITRERASSLVADSVALFEQKGYGLWFISRRDSTTPIGFCGFLYFHEPPQLQLIYAIEPHSWGTGYATEAASAMIQYGFDELQLVSIEASADVPNAASLRVLEKCGMKFERREVLHGLDTVFYSITR